jgi:hypothetical protein
VLQELPRLERSSAHRAYVQPGQCSALQEPREGCRERLPPACRALAQLRHSVLQVRAVRCGRVRGDRFLAHRDVLAGRHQVRGARAGAQRRPERGLPVWHQELQAWQQAPQPAPLVPLAASVQRAVSASQAWVPRQVELDVQPRQAAPPGGDVQQLEESVPGARQRAAQEGAAVRQPGVWGVRAQRQAAARRPAVRDAVPREERQDAEAQQPAAAEQQDVVRQPAGLSEVP